MAGRYRDSPSFIFLGRQVGYPVALEGALKLKELSYLRAEGFPAGELKHGPIALVEPGTVVIGVATRTPIWEKMMGNVAEVKSRGATVVLVADDGDEETARHADAVLWVPRDGAPVRPHRRRGAAAAVRLLAGPAPRLRRRPSPQPGQGGHRRVSGGDRRRPAGRAGQDAVSELMGEEPAGRGGGRRRHRRRGRGPVPAGARPPAPTWPTGSSPTASWPTPGRPPIRSRGCPPGSRPRRRP